MLSMGGGFVKVYTMYAQRQFGGDAWLSADVLFIASEWAYFTGHFSQTMLPFFGFLLLIAILMNVMQTGIVFLPDKLMPDPKRIDLFKGIGRMFSMQSVMRLVFGLFKIAIVCGFS